MVVVEIKEKWYQSMKNISVIYVGIPNAEKLLTLLLSFRF